jgi:hypothetical protein
MTVAEDILARAEEEGVEVGVREGRLVHRGGSHHLRQMLKGHEAAVVEALGQEHSAWQQLMKPEPTPIRRVLGRQAKLVKETP